MWKKLATMLKLYVSMESRTAHILTELQPSQGGMNILISIFLKMHKMCNTDGFNTSFLIYKEK